VRKKIWRDTREEYGETHEQTEEELTLSFASWNLISGWLTRLDGLRRAG
jgi:hypothetical protein